MFLLEVLVESFRLLRKEPKIYVPRIFTTIIYTVFLLYLASFSLKIGTAVNIETSSAQALGAVPDPAGVLAGFQGQILFFILFFLAVFAVDMLSYGMYAKIVEDHYRKRNISLKDAFYEALRKIKTLFLLGIVMLILLGLFILIYSLLSAAFIITRNPVIPVLTVAIIVIALVVFALAFFFSVPAAVLEDKGLSEAVSTSIDMGMKNKGAVLKVNFLFAGLIFITLGAAVFADFKGKIGLAAVMGFIAGRLLQAIVYTYISVVNPAVYMKLGGRVSLKHSGECAEHQYEKED